MKLILTSVMCVTISACGGVGTGLGDGGDNGSDGGNDSSTGNDATKNNDASSSDGSTTKDSGACPDEHGRYTVLLTGQGCGPSANTGNVCIQEDACAITFTTLGGGSNVMSSSAIPIASDGSFTGASITEGTSNRSGCTATWDELTATLVVDCGGTSTPQSCRATLVRKSSSCN